MNLPATSTGRAGPPSAPAMARIACGLLAVRVSRPSMPSTFSGSVEVPSKRSLVPSAVAFSVIGKGTEASRSVAMLPPK